MDHEIELIDIKKPKTEVDEVLSAEVLSAENEVELKAQPRDKSTTLNDWIVSSVEYDELWDLLCEFQVADRVSTVHKVWPQKATDKPVTPSAAKEERPSAPPPLPQALTLSGNIKVEETSKDQHDEDYDDPR